MSERVCVCVCVWVRTCIFAFVIVSLCVYMRLYDDIAYHYPWLFDHYNDCSVSYQYT